MLTYADVCDARVQTTPLTHFSGAKRTADGSTIDLSMEMDVEVTFGMSELKRYIYTYIYIYIYI
jgi:hypothetical protein